MKAIRGLRELFERAPAPEVREDAIRDESPVLLAQRRLSPEELVQQLISGSIEWTNRLDRRCEPRDLVRAKRHF